MNSSKSFIVEPAKNIPVIYEADVCVVGGSCTGVFAAVRAARLGARVVIVECQNSFGGVATNGLVSVWHSFYDMEDKKQVIAGLSEEILERLDDVDHKVGPGKSHFFNPTELKIELDQILKEENVKIYLHTYYSGLSCDGNKIDAIFVENKNGRGAIKAKFFIDATGDGDLCRDLGIESYTNDNIQPPSSVYIMQGTGDALRPDFNMDNIEDVVTAMINKYGKEFDIEPDWGWDNFIPSINGLRFRSDTHVFNMMCADADQLTEAEIIGREKMRKAVRIMRKYGDPSETYALVAACSYIGVRDTYHYKTKYKANYISLLTGEKYDDNIMNGTYNIDVHSQDNGISFMQFDGTYTTKTVDGETLYGNWRQEMGISPDIPIPTYYCLPFRSLVVEKFENIIAAGRMINADTESFGALRVMANLNQVGEAAGVAAYLSIDQNKSVQDIDGVEVAKTLSRGGSANLG